MSTRPLRSVAAAVYDVPRSTPSEYDKSHLFEPGNTHLNNADAGLRMLTTLLVRTTCPSSVQILQIELGSGPLSKSLTNNDVAEGPK